MTVVIDSNILICYALRDEPLHTKANQILAAFDATGISLAAPQLLRAELTATVRKVVYQKRISHEQGQEVLSKLLAFPVEVYDDDNLLKAAYELAARYNRPRAYDTQYMALAERLNCEFWSADEVLVNSTQAQFRHIRWLGEFADIN